MNNVSEFNINNLIDDIDEQISEGWRKISKLEELNFYSDHTSYHNEEYDFIKMQLEAHLSRIFISLSLALEYLQLHSLLKQLIKDYEKHSDEPSKLTMIPMIGEFDNELLNIFWKYYSSLSILIGKNIENNRNEEKRKLFESILHNTPKIVKDRKIEPKNESDVRKCIYELLIHVFPDTVREFPIVQETKTYKPDIGVRSLKSAVEYKFADSEQEVKTAIGGLYEDMRGYSGSADWTFFYAVVYMTDAYFTQEQILSEFKHTSADDNWKPILVFGKGARKRKI